MRFFTRSDVEKVLDLDTLRVAVAGAFAALSSGEATMAPRVSVTADAAGGWLGGMMAILPAHSIVTAKLVSVFQNQPASGLPTHQAVLVAFDAATGAPIAFMDATYITAARTAAASAVATDLLARRDVRVLAILGTGVQARCHARAVTRVRAFEEIVVAGRRPEAAEALVAELRAELGLPATTATFDRAMAHADVICATTHSLDPVVRGPSLRPGMHVNSVGVNRTGREVDAEAVRRSLVFVDSRAACLGDATAAGANDITWAIRDRIIGADHIHAEIGEVIAGTRTGRTSPEEVTLFKSVGVAVQDAAAAALVLVAAKEMDTGIELTF